MRNRDDVGVSVFDTTTLNSAHERNERRNKRRLIFVSVISIVLILAAILVIAAIFCRVSAVSVSGNDTYTEEEVISAAGIDYGMGIFSISRTSAENRIRHTLIGIETAKVTFSLPNRVNIAVTKGRPYYCFETNGKLYYLTENFICLGSDVDIDENDTVYRIGSDQIKTYRAGDKAVFYDDDWFTIIKELITMLKLCGLDDKVTVIEDTDKFDLVIRYDSRIKISLGEYKNIEEKLMFAKKTIDSLGEGAKGTVRIKNYKIGSFLKDEY